jgi:protein ImuB
MMFACIHGTSDTLPEIAAGFSPAFEQTAPDTVVFRVDGLQRLHGSPRQIAQAIARQAGDEVNVAIAETADAAIIAARNFPGVTVSPDLNDLDVATLPLTEEMTQVFESWGIYTLDQLAQLPQNGIAERFGPHGVYLQQLARGAIHRPLKIFQPETTYEDRIELDHPVSLLEPLLFLIARLLNDQCARLLSNAMAANEVVIRLELEDRTEHIRTLHLPVPMRESKPLLKLLQMDLEAHPPQAPTVALALSLKPVHPRTVQTGIFLPVTPAPDKLELTLARIRGIVGENNVGIPELLNTHHPHPYRLVQAQPAVTSHQSPTTSHQGFRYFRPPLPATVELDRNRPLRITASGIHGRVLKAAGPWRTSGDWWTTTVWNRDEWDVALTNNALYRIFREPTERWFIEGSYD